MRSIRNFWRKRRLLIICLLLVLISAGAGVRYYLLSMTLPSQLAGGRWSGESGETFAQVSCFLPVGGEKDLAWVKEQRDMAENSLTAASYELSEEISYYTDAYVGYGELKLSGPHGEATVSALGVGGDFFAFHPLRLRSGSYIGPQDVMGDRLVLDEQTAWRLFGGIDVAELSATMNGRPYYIAGVVELEEDQASRVARGDQSLVFIAYETLADMEATPGISCYELLMADPVQGFAASVFLPAFSEADGLGVENSGRFQPGNIFPLLTAFGQRSMVIQGIAFPYWENAARWTEDHLALLLPLIILPLLFPLFCLIRLMVRAWRELKRRIKQRVHDKQWARPEEKPHATPADDDKPTDIDTSASMEREEHP